MKFKIISLTKLMIVSGIMLLDFSRADSQVVSVSSPDNKINVSLFCEQNKNIGNWYLRVNYTSNGKVSEVIPTINLGLSRSDQDFYANLAFLKAGKPTLVNESYTVLHGKKSVCSNSG